MIEDNGKKFIKEADNVQEDWYKEAKVCKMEELTPFVTKLLDDYSHDADTIVHAMVAGCLATISAMNAHKEGDIGQSQAHKLLGLFVRKWAQIEGPAKLWSWAGLLHPGNEPQLMVVQPDVIDWLKNQAAALLKAGKYSDEAHRQHLIKITEGQFPWGFRGNGSV